MSELLISAKIAGKTGVVISSKAACEWLIIKMN